MTRSSLSEMLADATDVAGACQAVVDALVADGFAMPSIYLLRGGRLPSLHAAGRRRGSTGGHRRNREGWLLSMSADREEPPVVMFEPDAESQPREQRAQLQLERLRALVTRLRASGSPYWQAKLGEATAQDLGDLDDVRSLPLTTKAEFRDTYPLGMLAIPRQEVVRVHASSGTSACPRSPPTRAPTSTGNERDSLQRALADRLRDRLRIGSEVVLLDPGALPVQETGKAKRVYDWTADGPRPW